MTSIVWVISGLIVLIGIFLLLWFLPKWQIKKTGIVRVEDQFSAENEARKTLAQIFGGAAIIIGLIFSWQTIESQRKTLELQRDDLNIAKEQQITERFTRAIEQLGSEKLEVRLGGIYSLERIAKDSPELHWTIMEVLTTYVTERSPLQSKSIYKNKTHTKDSVITSDIQAALTVISRRKSEQDGEDHFFKLSQTNLKEANLVDTKLQNADLFNVNLAEAQLQKAKLKEAYLVDADLSGANLSGTDLKGAYLQKADLEGAWLIETELNRAKLYDANLTRSYLLHADFECAYLENANLTEAKLWIPIDEEKDFRRMYSERDERPKSERFDANFRKANLTGANLTGFDLSGINFFGANLTDLKGCQGFFNSDLRCTTLINVNLSKRTIHESDLSGAQISHLSLEGGTIDMSGFQEAVIEKSNLSNAFITATSFRKSTLRDIDLSNSELRGTNFSESTLDKINFECANLEDTNFEKAIITNATGIAIEQICKAKNLYETKFHTKCSSGGVSIKIKLSPDSVTEWDCFKGGTEQDCINGIKQICPQLTQKPLESQPPMALTECSRNECTPN